MAEYTKGELIQMLDDILDLSWKMEKSPDRPVRDAAFAIHSILDKYMDYDEEVTAVCIESDHRQLSLSGASVDQNYDANGKSL